MWKILNYKKPEDFVLATGKSFSVREFCEIALKKLVLILKWKGKGLKEKGYNHKNDKVLVEVDKRYFRPTEVDYLQGDASKAKKAFELEAQDKISRLVSEMIKVILIILLTDKFSNYMIDISKKKNLGGRS